MHRILIVVILILLSRKFNDILSRKTRSRATEETEDEVNYFQGFIGRLCPHAVLCKDKNDQQKYDFHCESDPNGRNDRTQTSGFVRMLNTTCQKWTTSRFDHQKQKIYVKCSEEGDQIDEVKM